MATRANHTDLRNVAPAHNTGAKCLGKLAPNRLMNHRIVKTATGVRRSSVWCRKGRAVL